MPGPSADIDPTAPRQIPPPKLLTAWFYSTTSPGLYCRRDPVEAIKFHMEQNGLKQKDLAAVIDSSSRASEVLNPRRPLTIDMIRSIHGQWGIPLESLVEAEQRAA